MSEISILELMTQFGALGLAAWMIWWATKVVIPRIQDQLEREIDESRQERKENRAQLAKTMDDHKEFELHVSTSMIQVAEALAELRQRPPTGPHRIPDIGG